MNSADWERVLSAAAHLQRIVPDAVLVGGTAAAIHAGHRFSYDDDHVVADLSSRFTQVLSDLETVAGWRTERLRPPVLILGELDGVETGVRNLIRSAPLETQVHETEYGPVTLPTLDEMLRIKSWLVVTRNATRDYLDAVALADRIETERDGLAVWSALESLDSLYPQSNGSSVVLQLAKQFAEPNPNDLGTVRLTEYRGVAERWRSWENVVARAGDYAQLILSCYQVPG